MSFMMRMISKWYNEESGLAAVESAMIFPAMLVLLVGVFDVGNAILANQKTVRASQIVADLIARKQTASAEDVSEAIEAGRLAFEPINNGTYGIDIVSLQFDDDAETSIVWRETRNMTSLPDPIAAVAALQTPNEGVVMVSVEYQFEPIFAGFVIDTINMREIAFSRGRGSAVVQQIP